MLKIVKYEFRKSRASLLVMLLIAAGLYLLAPAGRMLDREDMMACSMILLFLYSFAAFIYALVRGITAYSGELRGRTGYLLMLVPRSTMSILFGKLLFSLAFAALMLAVTALALGASFAVSFEAIVGESGYDVRGFLNMLRFLMAQMGMNPEQLAATALYFVVDILSSVLVLVGISYLSVTLSATILQEGRGRGFVSFLFFLALLTLTGWLEELVAPVIDGLYRSFDQALYAALPATILFLALTCAYTAASAALLKRRVSL